MTENTYTTPISTAFEFQRTALKQSQEAVERSVDLQRDVNAAMLDSMTTGQSGQREGVEFARRSILAYLDAVESTVPGSTTAVDDLRGSVEEGFDELLESHEDAFDTAEDGVERSIETYDEFSGEYVRAFEAQLEALLEAHEELERGTVETFERSLENYEEIQREMDAGAEEFAEAFEGSAEEFAEEFEGQLDRFREQLDDFLAQFEEMQRTATEA